jgi:hypothetical protein
LRRLWLSIHAALHLTSLGAQPALPADEHHLEIAALSAYKERFQSYSDQAVALEGVSRVASIACRIDRAIAMQWFEETLARTQKMREDKKASPRRLRAEVIARARQCDALAAQRIVERFPEALEGARSGASDITAARGLVADDPEYAAELARKAATITWSPQRSHAYRSMLHQLHGKQPADAEALFIDAISAISGHGEDDASVLMWLADYLFTSPSFSGRPRSEEWVTFVSVGSTNIVDLRTLRADTNKELVPGLLARALLIFQANPGALDLDLRFGLTQQFLAHTSQHAPHLRSDFQALAEFYAQGLKPTTVQSALTHGLRPPTAAQQESDVQEALKKNPDSPEADWLRLCRVSEYLREGKRKDAEEHVKAVRSNDLRSSLEEIVLFEDFRVAAQSNPPNLDALLGKLVRLSPFKRALVYLSAASLTPAENRQSAARLRRRQLLENAAREATSANPELRFGLLCAIANEFFSFDAEAGLLTLQLAVKALNEPRAPIASGDSRTKIAREEVFVIEQAEPPRQTIRLGPAKSVGQRHRFFSLEMPGVRAVSLAEAVQAGSKRQNSVKAIVLLATDERVQMNALLRLAEIEIQNMRPVRKP